MAQKFTPSQKDMALFTVVVALARSLAMTGALDRNVWLSQLLSARAWLVEHGDTSVGAFDEMMEMLSDI